MKNTQLKMLHVGDPAEELRARVGDLSNVRILHNNILCAVYIRPEQLASGIYVANQTRKEDEYQGKVVLVLKKGPLAFVDDANTSFAGQDVAIGEWAVLRSSDGWKLNVNGVLCQVVQDTQIRMTIPEPDVVL